MSRIFSVVAVFCVVFLGGVVGDAWGEVRYTVTPLDVQSGFVSCRPFGLNDAGVVVGDVQSVPGSDQVGILQGNTMVSLGTFGRTYAWGSDINANGQVIGTAQQKNGSYYYNEAFTLQNGIPTFLGMFSKTGVRGEGSTAMGINDGGQIVGNSINLNSLGEPVYRGFLWENGTMTDIGVPAGPYQRAFPYALNSNGTVVGFSDQNGSAREESTTGFVWSKTSGFSILPNQLGTGRLFPMDINDSGKIIGSYETTPFFTPGSQTKPFYYNGANMVDLQMPPGAAFAYPTEINNRGQIVGYFGKSGASGYFPVLWEDGQVYDIDSLVPSGCGPFDQSSAISINNNGQIILAETLPSGGMKGYLLTPVPEPSTIALLGMGLIGLMGWAWRRQVLFAARRSNT